MNGYSIELYMLIVAIITVVALTICSYCAIKRATKDNENAINASLKSANQQLKLQFFSEYTHRYQDLVLHTPPQIDVLSLQNKDVRTSICLYFDFAVKNSICIHKEIDDDIWELWVDGMKTIMKR